MSLTQEQFKKLSLFLSKIRINGEKGEKIENDISGILKYMELLNEIDTTGIEPTNNVVETEHVLREDNVIDSGNQIELLNCSELKVVGKQIVVSNIMK